MKESAKLTVPLSDLYSRFGNFMGYVRFGGKSLIITKRGKQLAKLVAATAVLPSKDGHRRFTRDANTLVVTPGQFKNQMSDLIAQVRFGNKNVLITYRGTVVGRIQSLEAQGNE